VVEPQRLRIFVSYRREDTEGMAGRLSDRFATWPDVDEVFVDVDVIPAGVDYREEITAALARCTVLIVLIGRKWLTVVDKDGRRRLDDPDDLLVFEIGSALRRPGVAVVPVLVDGAEAPAEADLPPRIAPLARLHAADLSHKSFGRDVDALRRDVQALVVAPPVDESEDPPVEGRPGHKRRAGAYLALAGILLVFAAVRFAIIARPPTRADLVADVLAAAAVGVVGVAMLLRPPWSGAAGEAAAGVFLGVCPFVAARMWWSAQLRGAVPPLYLESPLWMILAALGAVLFLVARTPGGFERPRLGENAAFAAGVAAAVGLVAIGCVLSTTDDDLATLRLSDPVVLLASAALAVAALTTRGLLQGAVLVGWAAGLCGVAANTAWLLRHAEFGIPVGVLGAHLALSFLAVLAVVTAVAVRRRSAARLWPVPGR
jgi:hypothetical protein